MRRLKTFLSLALADKAAFIRAWLYLAAATLSVRTAGLARTLAWLVPQATPTAANPTDPRDRRHWPRAALWLPIAMRYCPGSRKCLERSVALHALLRRAGIPSELRIGIGTTDPKVEAHAWIEVAGIPVNDSADVAQRYKVFDARATTS